MGVGEDRAIGRKQFHVHIIYALQYISIESDILLPLFSLKSSRRDYSVLGYEVDRLVYCTLVLL